MKALWIHDGNPERPHAALSSSKHHSNGFFNSEIVMENPVLLDDAGFDLVVLLGQNGLDWRSIDRVVGPAMGAITLAHAIALVISQRAQRNCLCAYARKKTSRGQRTMALEKRAIREGEHVLICEDVITTGQSADLTAMAVANAGGVVVPFVASLVNRSGQKEINGRRIIALIDRDVTLWHPDECPLCKQGSRALSPPKSLKNWSRLTAAY